MGLLLLLMGDFVEDSRAQWQVKDLFYKCKSLREIVFFLDKNLPYFHSNILDTIGFSGTLDGKSAKSRVQVPLSPEAGAVSLKATGLPGDLNRLFVIVVLG